MSRQSRSQRVPVQFSGITAENWPIVSHRSAETPPLLDGADIALVIRCPVGYRRSLVPFTDWASTLMWSNYSSFHLSRFHRTGSRQSTLRTSNRGHLKNAGAACVDFFFRTGVNDTIHATELLEGTGVRHENPSRDGVQRSCAGERDLPV